MDEVMNFFSKQEISTAIMVDNENKSEINNKYQAWKKAQKADNVSSRQIL